MNITRKIVFHAGHMLKDDTAKCYHPHGHEYVVECTIRGAIQETGAESGMVMNFGNLKQIMMEEIHDQLDHKFIIERTDPRFENFIDAVGLDAVFIVDFPPTAEDLVTQFYVWISNRLPDGIEVSKIRLQETLNCWAEFQK